MLNFVFEDIDNLRNLFNEDEILTSGVSRVTISPYVNRLRQLQIYYSKLRNGKEGVIEYFGNEYCINICDSNKIINEKYIIPIGVTQSPENWIGGAYGNTEKERKLPDLFSKLSEKYLNDIRNKKAFLLFDSSHEGYFKYFIFDYFHSKCLEYRISPTQIIYVSGNSIIEDKLVNWAKTNSVKELIQVIPYSHFEFDISEVVRNRTELNLKKIPNFQDQFDYKIKNFDNIKIFNFLNKKPRGHRIWFYHKLKEYDLLKHGLISMNPVDSKSKIIIDSSFLSKGQIEWVNKDLPTYAYGISNEIEPFKFYMDNLNERATLDSWFSIVSETHYEDKQETVFLSEKVFKPIACQHPFVVLGNKGSLKELKKLGYKTFHDLIDESYDNLDSNDRFHAISVIINSLKSNPDKLQWFEWLRPTLEYNSKLLLFNSTFKPPAGFHKLIELLK
jgi:hypothetical protein